MISQYSRNDEGVTVPRGKTQLDFNKNKKDYINGWADERMFDNEDDVQKKLNATQKMTPNRSMIASKNQNNSSIEKMTNSQIRYPFGTQEQKQSSAKFY